jgi:heptosyltransferase-1
MRAARRALNRHPYDYVVDTQGLVKSALVARMAQGARFGFDRASAREPFAARFYDQPLRVARAQHAVERNRRLVADVFGYEVDTLPDYGIAAPPSAPSWAPPRYYVALRATSRADKHWPDTSWIELRSAWPPTAGRGYPGGAQERTRPRACRRNRRQHPRATDDAVGGPPQADGVIGVDTGLTHPRWRSTTDPRPPRRPTRATGLHGDQRP